MNDPYTAAAERRCPTCGCPLTECDGRLVPDRTALDKCRSETERMRTALRDARVALRRQVDAYLLSRRAYRAKYGDDSAGGILRQSQGALQAIDAVLGDGSKAD